MPSWAKRTQIRDIDLLLVKPEQNKEKKNKTLKTILPPLLPPSQPYLLLLQHRETWNGGYGQLITCFFRCLGRGIFPLLQHGVHPTGDNCPWTSLVWIYPTGNSFPGTAAMWVTIPSGTACSTVGPPWSHRYYQETCSGASSQIRSSRNHLSCSALRRGVWGDTSLQSSTFSWKEPEEAVTGLFTFRMWGNSLNLVRGGLGLDLRKTFFT